jgi:hypothetical protein
VILAARKLPPSNIKALGTTVSDKLLVAADEVIG